MAGGVDLAAQSSVAGISGPMDFGQQMGIGLDDTRAVNCKAAVVEALAPLSFQQRPLLRGDGGRHGEIVVRRERPIVRCGETESVVLAVGGGRHQPAGLALHRRVRHGKIRHPQQRNAQHFQPGVLEIDHLLQLVVDDADRLDLPFRRFSRVVLARLARGIDAALKHRVIAARAFRQRRGEPGLVRRFQPQRIHETVAELVVEIEDLPVDDLAVRLDQAHVAFRLQALRLLVVGDLVGLERGAVVIDLHAADRRNPLIGIVVMDLVRLDEHLRIGIGLRGVELARSGLLLGDADPLGAERGALVLLGGGFRRAGRLRAEPAGDPCQRQHQAAAMQPGARTGGGRPGHHPSSWYNRATKPVRPPTSTGSHAAATGCISSALLKSSVTFDNT